MAEEGGGGDKMDIDPPLDNVADGDEKNDVSQPNSTRASPEPEAQPDAEAQPSEPEQPQQIPESLIAGRAKRSTAGNRLAALLDREAVEADDIDLLFEENEDDEEFEGKEESDIELGSSSDEEDNAGGAGNQGGDDEMTGERELEREAKEERAKEKKRRAAKDSFLGQQQMKKLFGGSKKQDPKKPKKVQIQEPHESSPVDAASPSDSVLERQRKKSERISWIPTVEDKPSRQSSRRQTVANKKVTHQRLKEAEERRIKTINTMNEAMQRKKKDKQVVWTQEMRLEEAKKTEELNKKSLNKWEELELQRAEARRLKLEALHNRKLKGAMITFYSKAAEWQDSRKLVEEVDDSGAKEVTTGKKRGRPRLAEKDGDKSGPASKEKSSSDEGQKDVAMTDAPKEDKNSKVKEEAETLSPKTTETSPKESGPSLSTTAEATPKESGPSLNTTAEATSKESVVPSINTTAEAAPKESMPSLNTTAEATPRDVDATNRDAEASPKEKEPSPKESDSLPKEVQTTDEDVQMEDTGAVVEDKVARDGAGADEGKTSERAEKDEVVSAAASTEPESAQQGSTQDKKTTGPEPTEPESTKPASPQPASIQPATKTDPKDVGVSIYIDPAEKIAEAEAVKHVPNISSRTFIILQNFDKEAIQTKEYQGKVLFPHNKGPMPRPDKPLCVVTNLPARFRDPATGLPYANLFAYRQIQRVRSGEIKWSNTLQCFVGVQAEAAAGVPEGFLMLE